MLYELVLDIEAYPEFVPYCTAAQIIEHNHKSIIADLTIQFSIFRQKYRSLVMLQPGEDECKITVESISWPIKSLSNIWLFQSHEQGAIVTIDLKCSLKSAILSNILGIAMHDVASKTMTAFENRAIQIYGKVL